ncbi:hypothetical protein GCM10027202_21720 [Microvirgula curvata]
MDADFQRLAHFVRALADAGEHDLAGFAAGGQHATDFADRHGVETGTEAGEVADDGQVRVGFQRVADQMVDAGKRIAIGAIGLRQCRFGVYVARRAEGVGDLRERDVFDEEFAILILKSLHGY